MYVYLFIYLLVYKFEQFPGEVRGYRGCGYADALQSDVLLCVGWSELFRIHAFTPVCPTFCPPNPLLRISVV